MPIGVETSDGTIALSENAATFFDERLDVGDKLLFVKLLAWCAVGLFDELRELLVHCRNMHGR